MAKQWEQYDRDMSLYNKDVQNYNDYIRDKVFYINTMAWSNMKAWRSRLDIESVRLDNIRKGLPECFADPLGIVKSIETYW
jgi:hypothetical protein